MGKKSVAQHSRHLSSCLYGREAGIHDVVDLETSKVSSKKSSSITRKSNKSKNSTGALITTKYDKKKSKKSEHLHTDPFSNGPTQRMDMSELGIVLETEKELPTQKFIQKT